METLVKAVGTFMVYTLVFLGLSLLSGYPTLWMVNYLFTPQTLLSLFGISTLTFWKAFWLNFLCASLFKSTSTSSSK